MNKRTKICFLALVLVAFSFDVHGQNAPSKTPSPPYISPLTGDFTLAKKFTYKKKPDQISNPTLTAEQRAVQKTIAAYKDPKEIDIIEVGNVRKDTWVFVDGTSRENWKSGPWQFIQNPMHPDQYVVTAVRMGDSTFISGDFSELQWINGGAFKGEQTMAGVKCYVYKSGDETAWVDELTDLPVYFESSTMQISYTYGTPPATPLQLPDNLVKKLQEVKKAWSGQ